MFQLQRNHIQQNSYNAVQKQTVHGLRTVLVPSEVFSKYTSSSVYRTRFPDRAPVALLPSYVQPLVVSTSNPPSSQDIADCNRSFSELLSAASFDGNQPQTGFNMGELLAKLGSAPGAFIEACQTLRDAANRTTDVVQSITNAVAAALPWLSAFIKTTILCVTAGVLVYAILTRRPALAGGAAGVLTALAVVQGFVYHKEVTDLIHRLLEKVSQLSPSRQYQDPGPKPYETSFVNEAQGEDSTVPLVPLDQSLISKLFVSMFSCGFFILGDKNKSAFSVLKDYVVHFPSIVKGIDQAVEFASKIALQILNYVRTSFGYGTFDSLWEHSDPFVQWMDKVTKFINEFENRDRKPNSNSYGMITQFIEEGRRHSLFLKSVSDDAGAKSRLGVVLTRLAAARDACAHANTNIVSSRPEPICVYLYGAPGYGKTWFAKLLAQAWLTRNLSPAEFELFQANMSAYIYHRTPETQYWDGYANQAVCIFDDFLQKKELTGGDSVALDIIRCLNNNPALLHMAALNDKGTSYFTSKLVILSSNVQVPNSPAVESQDAICRRPDFFIHVDMQPELKKPTQTLGDSSLDTDVLAFINSKNTWPEKTCVYDLQRYAIGLNRVAVPLDKISPVDLLEAILRKGQFNEDKFKCTLPPMPPPVLKRGENLMAAFLGRQEALVPKPNAPQGDPGFCAAMRADVKWPTYLGAYVTALSRQCDDDVLEAARATLESFIVRKGFTWRDFQDEYETFMGPILRSRVLDRPNYSSIVNSIKTHSIGGEDHDNDPTYFRKLFSGVKDAFELASFGVKSLFTSYWPFLVGTATAFGVALVMYRAFNYWTSEPNHPESVPSRVHSKVPPRAQRGFALFRRGPDGKKEAPPVVNNPQSSEAMQAQIDKVLRHTYHLFWDSKGEKAFGHLVMLADRVGVLNQHTVDIIKQHVSSTGVKILYFRPFGRASPEYQVSVDSLTNITRSENAIHFDIGLVNLDRTQLPTAPNFIDKIPPFADFVHRTQLSVLAPEVVTNTERRRYVTDPQARLNYETGSYHSEYTNEINITYAMSTQRGHCGLPIVTDSLSQGKYLVGIHKCGTGTLAGAAPLIREWVDQEMELLKTLYPDLQVILHQEVVEIDKPPTNFPQCYPAIELGVVKAFHMSHDTKLEPLPHIHMFEQSTAPAQLDVGRVNGRWVSPYHINREKIPRLHYLYPDVPDIRRLISELVNDPTMKEMADLGFWRRNMTFDEAVFGIPNTCFTSLDMTTSVGYPMVLTGFTTKRSWVEDPGRFAQLRREVMVADGLLRRGIRPLFLTMDFMKDERRVLEKVADFKTRVIAGGAFVLLILCRMYFGGFSAWTNLNAIENGITIPMNPYSKDFDYMCRSLFKPDFKTFQGDSEAFDLKQHAHVERHIFNAVNDWYGKSDPIGNSVRDLLSLDFIFARHVTTPVHVGPKARADLLAEPVPDDPFVVSQALKIVNASDNGNIAWVYEMSGGDPSGNYLTALINSWYSKVKPFLALQFFLRDIKVVLGAARHKRLVPQTLGDDFITSVAPEFQKVLNALTFKNFSASYGMNITRENKQPITEPFPDEDPVFLKRVCYYSHDIGRWVGALDQTAIIDAMCWMRKKSPSVYEMTQSFEIALFEFSLWGPAVYNKWAPKIEEAARFTLHRTYVARTWKQALDEVLALKADFRP